MAGPAFPTGDVFNPDHGENGRVERGFNGMSLRDWLAGRILPEIFRVYDSPFTPQSRLEIANDAYLFADAMIAERDK